MCDEVDRFFRRKKMLKEAEEQSHLVLISGEELVLELMNSPIDWNTFNEIQNLQGNQYAFDFDTSVSAEQITALIGELEGTFDEAKFDALLTACRDTVISNIIKPFGLAHILFEDRLGGNVTTAHNFEKGHEYCATSEDQERYRVWKQDYDRAPYEKDFKRMRKYIFKHSDKIADGYTGKKLSKDGRTELDHITPVHTIDKDPGSNLFMTQGQRMLMANADANLTLTDKSLNRSKNDSDLLEWKEKKASNPLVPGQTNSEKYEIDERLAQEKHRISKRHIEKEILKNQVLKQGSETLKTGAREGLKMGLQQAVGLLLHELVIAMFWEVKDIYANGIKSGSIGKELLPVMKERLERVGNRVLDRWQHVARTFFDGAISGFISNLITVAINMFLTTGRRVVRIIREGLFSLLRAVKMLLLPPEGMTPQQAAHEASKLIAAGLTIAGGIMLEEAIDKLITAVPPLKPFADVFTTVLVGLATGLATTFLVYSLDKLDLFGVNASDRYLHVLAQLEADLNALFAETDKIIIDLKLSPA